MRQNHIQLSARELFIKYHFMRKLSCATAESLLLLSGFAASAAQQNSLLRYAGYVALAGTALNVASGLMFRVARSQTVAMDFKTAVMVITSRELVVPRRRHIMPAGAEPQFRTGDHLTDRIPVSRRQLRKLVWRASYEALHDCWPARLSGFIRHNAQYMCLG